MISLPKYDLTVVIPLYYSELTIKSLIENLYSVLKDLSFEVILINDGSTDQTEYIALQLVKTYKNLKLIQLQQNYGEHNAVICGLNHVSGKYAVIIDDDFQNPPTEILKLFNKANTENLDVVYTKYTDKKHHFFRNLGSKLINFLLYFAINKPIGLYLSSFKIVHYQVVAKVILNKQPLVYLDALILKTKPKIGVQLVEHYSRVAGKSGYTFKKLVKLALVALLSNTNILQKLNGKSQYQIKYIKP